MGHFIKLPVEIEAVQFTDDEKSWNRVKVFCGVREVDGHYVPQFNPIGTYSQSEDPSVIAEVWDKLHSTWVGVKAGQWIIEGVQGEFYPCDDAVFRVTYVPALTSVEEPSFERELASLINKYSLEGMSDTPDFILAGFLQNVLTDWNRATRARDKWKGN